MSMDLAACCRLAQDIAGVAVTLLAEPAQYTAFCIANQFSPIQTYLLPQQFGRSIESLSDGEILSLMDLFQIRYLFFRLNGIPMGIGPFCTEFFSLADCDRQKCSGGEQLPFCRGAEKMRRSICTSYIFRRGPWNVGRQRGMAGRKIQRYLYTGTDQKAGGCCQRRKDRLSAGKGR